MTQKAHPIKQRKIKQYAVQKHAAEAKAKHRLISLAEKPKVEKFAKSDKKTRTQTHDDELVTSRVEKLLRSSQSTVQSVDTLADSSPVTVLPVKFLSETLEIVCREVQKLSSPTSEELPEHSFVDSTAKTSQVDRLIEMVPLETSVVENYADIHMDTKTDLDADNNHCDAQFESNCIELSTLITAPEDPMVANPKTSIVEKIIQLQLQMSVTADKKVGKSTPVSVWNGANKSLKKAILEVSRKDLKPTEIKLTTKRPLIQTLNRHRPQTTYTVQTAVRNSPPIHQPLSDLVGQTLSAEEKFNNMSSYFELTSGDLWSDEYVDLSLNEEERRESFCSFMKIAMYTTWTLENTRLI